MRPGDEWSHVEEGVRRLGDAVAAGARGTEDRCVCRWETCHQQSSRCIWWCWAAPSAPRGPPTPPLARSRGSLSSGTAPSHLPSSNPWNPSASIPGFHTDSLLCSWPGATRCHPARKPQARGAPEARPRGHGHDLHVSEGSGETGVSSRCGPRAGPRSGPLTGVSVVGQGGWRVGRGATRPLGSPGSRFTGGSCWGGPPALGLCDSGVKTAHCGPPLCPPV